MIDQVEVLGVSAIPLVRKLGNAALVELRASPYRVERRVQDIANAQSDSLGFDATWEIDLFGHVRRSVEAARADLGAEQANYQDAQVTVAAEVARNYFELRGAQEQLQVDPFLVLPERAEEGLVRQGSPGGADDPVAGRQKSGTVEVVQPREELAPGEIAGRAEEDDHVVARGAHPATELRWCGLCRAHVVIS